MDKLHNCLLFVFRPRGENFCACTARNAGQALRPKNSGIGEIPALDIVLGTGLEMHIVLASQERSESMEALKQISRMDDAAATHEWIFGFRIVCFP